MITTTSTASPAPRVGARSVSTAAIVKSIMALHGGTVSVQSELGKGSTFSLSFPLEGVFAAADR